MKIAALPADEELRLSDLYSYEILDTNPEREYDDLVQLASQICGCPISFVSFVDRDRQWMKAKKGVDSNQTSRDEAFCAHTILTENTFIVEDSLKDERFFDNPFVTGPLQIRFYAGEPIVTPTGHRVGSVCVLDNKPGKLTEQQQNALKIISRQITKLMELRSKHILLRKRANEIIELKDECMELTLQQRDESDRNVAAELHEQIAQKVATCHLYLNMFENDAEMMNDMFPLVKQTMNELISEIRNLSNSIAPATLPSVPFQLLLNEFANKSANNYPFNISVSFSGDMNKLTKNSSTSCFHIIERWLHALAQNKKISKVNITVAVNEQIEICLTDNALKADYNEIEKQVVMSTVYSRVKMCDGSVSYTSVSDKKNNLEITFPLSQ